MALALTATLQQSADCTQLFLNDTTGVYNAVTNPGGYGSPNPVASTATAATISGTIYTPGGGTTVINSTAIFPTTPNPAPFVVGEGYLLTPTILGLSTSTFPDGIYVLTYTVVNTGGGPWSASVTFQQLITCNTDCSLGNVLANYSPCPCESKDIDGLFENFMLIMGAKAAAGNTMNSKGLDDILVVQNYLSAQNQGCGCS